MSHLIFLMMILLIRFHSSINLEIKHAWERMCLWSVQWLLTTLFFNWLANFLMCTGLMRGLGWGYLLFCFAVRYILNTVDNEKIFWVIFSSAIWSSLTAKLEIEQHLSKSDLSRHEKLAFDEKCKNQNPVCFLH